MSAQEMSMYYGPTVSREGAHPADEPERATPMSEPEVIPASTNVDLDQELKLATAIEASVDRGEVLRSVLEYLNGYNNFIFPKSLSQLRDGALLRPLLQQESTTKERVLSTAELITDIIVSFNERAAIQSSAEYQALIQDEQSQWCADERECEHLGCGVRCCVDQGIPREAVVGSVDPLGRSLAGDDKLRFSESGKGFRLETSSIKKKLIHLMRQGKDVMLEFLVEHTGCGRRAQMLANMGAEDNGISEQFRLLFDNLQTLAPEFNADPRVADRQLMEAQTAWSKGAMAKDGGLWAGIFMKVAQAQAYRHLTSPDQEASWIVPIKVYDKHKGGSLVGLDNLDVLTDPRVLAAGGFTNEVLEELITEEKVISLENSVTNPSMQEHLMRHLSVAKGAYTFADLQNNQSWFEVKKALIATTKDLWSLYNSETEGQQFRDYVSRYLTMILHRDQNDLRAIRDGKRTVGETMVTNRIVHQLFRELAYAWTLSTFEMGNEPGHHMEDHLAIGDSSILGATEHLPLGQGDLMQPSILEAITGYSVLMHSEPGHKNEPVVAMLMFDTANADSNVPTDTYVNNEAISTLRMLLKQWPQIVIGDIVPVILIVNKENRSVNRIALSLLLALDSIVDQEEEGNLPMWARASASSGEVVLVPAELLFQAGLTAGEDLKKYRELSIQIADQHNNRATQESFRQSLRRSRAV